jgi:threonine/homoserine/homoserine lactone efflux protein
VHRRRRGHGAGRGDALNPTELLPHGAAALGFAVAVLVLNATPGVDLLLTVTRTLQRGPRAGLAAAAGVGAGSVGHALAAAFGLAALLAVHPGAFRVLQYASAAYLAWLGLGLLRRALDRPDHPAVHATADAAAGATADGPAVRPSVAADFRAGLLTNLLNPKVALFFLAFLPAFVPAASPSKTVSFLLLGAWFVVQSFVFLAGLVVLVAAVGARGSAAARRALQAGGGLLFLALAARLLADPPAPALEIPR